MWIHAVMAMTFSQKARIPELDIVCERASNSAACSCQRHILMSSVSVPQCARCPTLQRVPEDTKAAGYRTWLGFYKGYCGKIGWSPEELVQQANYFSEVIGERNGKIASIMWNRTGMLGSGRALHAALQGISRHDAGVLL